MASVQNPSSFITGGGVISGDIEIQGILDQDPIIFGRNAIGLEGATVIGVNAEVGDEDATAIGFASKATNQNTTAFGKESEATGGDATALGNEATAPSRWNTVIGYDAGADEETVGLEPNGDNVVLVGRESQASGDNGVAIGEISRANGDNSTAVGRGTQAFADNSSVFGQGSVSMGSGTTIVGQDVSVMADEATSVGTEVDVSGFRATAIGRNSSATAENSTAVGVSAEANGINSLAVGNGTVVDQDNTFSFGDRNINLPVTRSILYPNNAGEVTLVDFGINDEAAAGLTQSYSFEINSEPIFELSAITDGDGGIEDASANVPGVLTAVGKIALQDSEGNDLFSFDNTGGTPFIDFAGTQVRNIQSMLAGGVEVTGVFNNQIRVDAINVTDFADSFLSQGPSPHQIGVNITNGLESDGANSLRPSGGQIADVFLSEGNNPHQLSVNIGRGITGDGDNNISVNEATEFNFENVIDFISGLDVSDDITDGTTVIWDSSEGYVNQDALENSVITLNAGNGLKNGSTAELGGAFGLDIEPADFVGSYIIDEGSDLIAVNIGSGIRADQNNGDKIAIDADSISDTFLSQSDSGPHQISVNIGRGLEGDGANNIRLNEDTSFDFTNLIDFDSGIRLSSGTSVNIPQDAVPQTLVSYPVTASSSVGAERSYTFDVGDTSIIKAYAESDGSGSVQNPELRSLVNLDVTGNDIYNNGTLIWNSDLEQIEQNVLENDSIQIVGGNGLKNGSTAALGGSFSLDVEPADFIGTYISESSDLISVNIDRGLEGDGSDNIIVDEGTDFTFTSTAIDFINGFDTAGDITDGAQTIWDTGTGEIPDSALGLIDNDTIRNSNITVSPGNALTGGGQVDLGSSITLGIATDAIQVPELDQSIVPTWTGTHVFDSGLDVGSRINMQSTNRVINLPDPSDPFDSANKSYVDSVAEGLTVKGSCVAATDGTNIDLSTSTSVSTVDGISISNGDRLLLKDQTDKTENGIYDAVDTTDTSTWVRSSDFNEDSEVVSGAFTFVANGDVNGSVSFTVTDQDPITLGTDEINFSQFATAGEIVGANGIIKDGLELSIDVPILSGFGIEGANSDSEFRVSSEIIGDGLSGASGSVIDIVASEIAGSGISPDGSNNLELTENSVIVNASDGLSDGGSVSLGSSIDLNINPGDFAGTFISTETGGDSLSDLTLNIGRGIEGDGSGNISVDEDVGYSFTSLIDFQSGLDTRGDIVDNTTTVWDSGIGEVPDAALGTISNTILDENQVTVTAGNGLTTGGTVQLGSSITIDVDVIANSDLQNSSLTISPGNGLTGGGATALGSSSTLSVAAADFAGTFISTDVDGDLTLDLGTGLEDSGTGLLQFDEDVAYSFTSAIDFASGFDTTGDIEDSGNAVTIWDSANGEIPDTALGSIANATLENSSITINAGNGLIGTAIPSLGESVTLNIADSGVDIPELNIPFTDLSSLFGTPISVGGQLNLAADIISSASEVIWDDSNSYIPQGRLQNDSIDISAGGGITGGGSTPLGNVASIAVDASSVAGNGLAVGDNPFEIEIGGSSIGTGELDLPFTQLSDLFAGPISLGDNLAAPIGFQTVEESKIDLYGGDYGFGINTSELTIFSNGSVNIRDSGFSGTSVIEFDASTGNAIFNGSGEFGGVLNMSASSSIQDAGVDVLSFDGAQNVSIPNGDLDVGNINISQIIPFDGSTPISLPDAGFELGDNVKNYFGSNQDFAFEFDAVTDELVLTDLNGVELIRQAKSGVTQFLQGIDAGPISAPEDSFTQILNAPVTGALGSGTRVGYTFSLDNQSFIEIDAESDGSGGIQNTKISLNAQDLDFSAAGIRRANLDLNGNLSIDGELTEGAAL